MFRRRIHPVREVGDAEPDSKVRPVSVQQIVAADAEMKGEAEARFSMSSQRRPRSFKEIPTLLRRRVYTRLSMMGIFRQSDGVLHSLR